jgi:uncharacterized protein YlzI (FlbEa/FlbD family)
VTDNKYETNEITGFAGVNERAEDTARIETSNGPPRFIMHIKNYEATVTYVENKDLNEVGQYLFGKDIIAFNPEHPYFPQTTEGRAAFRWHEAIHRADKWKYVSWINAEFLVAIETATVHVNNTVVMMDGKTLIVFESVLEELKQLTVEDNIAVQDILSALRYGKNDGLQWWHRAEYWQSDSTHRPIEIFANMGTLDLLNGKGLDVIKRYFPELFNAYRRMVR